MDNATFGVLSRRLGVFFNYVDTFNYHTTFINNNLLILLDPVRIIF